MVNKSPTQSSTATPPSLWSLGQNQRGYIPVLEMPLKERGNCYVFDYLTKWVEAYVIEDQTSETIAWLLVDNVVCHHGVPGKLLSDRGANLLTSLIIGVCKLLGMCKLNTTAYHPRGMDWLRT